MGTRGWMLSTFVGCCVWILHGLRAAAAIPVTTEEPFATGTASPITAESEEPRALLMSTAETSTTAADAEIAESILMGSPASPSFPPGAEPDGLVTAASEYSSTVPTLMNVSKPLNTSQDNERGSAASAAATTAATISAQHPAVTPEAELDVTEVTPNTTLGTTPPFADMKEDVLVAVTREGADPDSTTGAVSLPTTPPPAAAWGAQPTAGSPMGAGVTALPSQGLTTATGAVKEGITLPVDIQNKDSANSSSPSPGAGGLLTTQQAMGITPEPAGEMAPATEESPLASVPENVGDAVNGTFSTAGSSHLPLESLTVSGAVGNPGEPSFLLGQAALSPAASLAPTGGRDGDGQGTPGMSSDTPDSAPLLAASETPAVTGDTATSLLAPRIPTDAQSDTNPPALATALPTGDVGAVGLAEPSLEPAPWQGSTGEQTPLLAKALPSPMDTPSAPGAAYPPLGVAYPPLASSTLPAADNGAETPVSPDLGAAQGTPVPPSLWATQPWGTADGAPQGAGLPGANGPGTGLTSTWTAPSSASYGPAGPPSPALGDQLGTNLGLPAVEGLGAGMVEQALGGVGSGTGFDPSLSSATGSGTDAGMDQLPGAGSPSGPASPSHLFAASSIVGGNGAGPIPATAPGPDSLSPASLDSETGPELAPVQGVEGTGDVAQAGNSESRSPYMEMSPSAISAQQDPANTGKLLAGGTGTLVNAELSPSSALGDGAGAALALGQVSLPGPIPSSSAGLGPDLSGAEGPGDLPGKSPSAPGAAYPPPGAVAGPVSGAETSVSPDLGAAQGTPVPPSLWATQPWGTADGAPQGAGLPGANGPGTGLTSTWTAPSSASYGPAGPPSPALGDQLGTNLGLPAVEGLGAGMAEQVLGGVGSGTGFDPSLSSATGSGMAAGMDQLPGAGSPSGPASPSGVVTASSVFNPASLSALRGAGGAPGALQPSLGAGPGVPPAAGQRGGEAAGDEGSLGQSQAPVGGGPDVSGGSDGEMGAVLHSASSPSTEGSSSHGTGGEAANGASLPGAGGADGGLSTGLEAAGPEGPSVSAPGVQSGANLGLSDAKLSHINVVELPGGGSVNRGPSPGASLGEGAGAIIQIASGVLAPSALASPQEMQPLVPVPPDGSGVSNSTTASLAAALLLPRHGLSSGLAPNGDPHSAPGTQSGSRPLVPGALGGLAGDAGGAHMWSLEDEVASGMPAPLGEASPHAPASPNAAPVLSSALQRENSAEGVSTGPRVSTPLSARESIVGSSAGGRGELGAAARGDPALLLPPHQPGNPGVPSRDSKSPIPGEAMVGRGDMAQPLPGVAGAGAAIETPTRSLPGGSPGLPGLPPARIAADSPGSKVPGPGLASGSSPATLQPFLHGKVPTSLANGAPAASGLSLPTAFPGQGGTQGGSPGTVRPATSCSPAAANPAPPAPLPGGRKALPRPAAAAVTSRASSPVFPAPPGGPAATPTPLPISAVAAVPLYGYGVRENDREYVERRVDFNSPLFKPETGFPFGKTLRDSLYFTDNGQIIFPASDNSIFTYPNPPPRGFNGHEEVPMIAVFWDNADFSRGVGTTFYQEFLTLNTAKPPFVRDVEAKVRQYLRSSYSAAWTLKITWEKAPAYAARTDTRRTITYQAVLTTDGFRSYVLMLYQEGGMQWDYTRLAATNVLIGYTSGDGFYRNDDLTQRPPAAKYRPDQFRGYNTDLRGLWIYKLESRVGVNYRLKCLAWTGRQQEPRAWSQGLPACPCSLQQGQRDLRFKSSWGGWWATRVSMLHSASPNQHGAGVRCLYDSQSQLIEGRQERYWRSSRQASPYRDQELKLYNWCCNQAGSARLCARYSEKRPKIGCDGYQSPGIAGSSEEAESDSEDQNDEEDK